MELNYDIPFATKQEHHQNTHNNINNTKVTRLSPPYNFCYLRCISASLLALNIFLAFLLTWVAFLLDLSSDLL